MAIPDDKNTEYLVERFRQLGSSTTKWALLFFLAIAYTWLVSIYPRQTFIKNYITVVDRQTHFDTLGKETSKKKRSYLTLYSDSLKKLRREIPSLVLLKGGAEVFTPAKNLKELISKARRGQEDRDSLKQLLVQKALLKGKEKKKLRDSIRRAYLPLDVLVAMADIQKSEAGKQSDSLTNKMMIPFNVPGMNAINFGFRGGLIFWMILTLVLLLYVFSIRLAMIHYLKKIYASYYKEFKLDIKEWKKLDLRVPLWMAPIRFKKCQEEKICRELIGWNFVRLNNVLGVGLVALIVALQFQVAWLCWHVSFIRYLENDWLKIITIVLVCLSFLLFLLWLQPISLSPAFPAQDAFSFKRREYIKAGLAAALLVFAFPPIGRTIPLIKGNDLNYKRSRQRKNGYKTELADGVYLHKTNSRKVVYYFRNGIPASRRGIGAAKMKQLEKKLVPMDIKDIIGNPRSFTWHIPYWPSILETEAYRHALRKDLIPAIEILLFGLAYSGGKGANWISHQLSSRIKAAEGPRHKKNNSVAAQSRSTLTPEIQPDAKVQERLKYLLIGLILRAEKHLSGPQAEDVKKLMEKYTDIPPDILSPDQIDRYRAKKKFATKWQSEKDIPWQLPDQLPRHKASTLYFKKNTPSG